MTSHSPQMFITASVLKSSPSIHSRALNCEHTKTSRLQITVSPSRIHSENAKTSHLKEGKKHTHKENTDTQLQLPGHMRQTASHLGQTWRKNKQEATVVSVTSSIEILYVMVIILQGDLGQTISIT